MEYLVGLVVGIVGTLFVNIVVYHLDAETDEDNELLSLMQDAFSLGFEQAKIDAIHAIHKAADNEQNRMHKNLVVNTLKKLTPTNSI